MRRFHKSGVPIRCLVGPVGSGKTSAATWEICRYLPEHIAKTHGLRHTKWVVRNTYPELRDTMQRTLLDWKTWNNQENLLRFPRGPISS
jgi:hypothetical protein